MKRTVTAALLIILSSSVTAGANDTAPPNKLTKEMVTEFYARGALAHTKPFDEYRAYLDDIFTADVEYTDRTEVIVPNRKMPAPSTQIYDKAKILELAKPVHESLKQGALSNLIKGIYIADDGLSARVAVKRQVDGIHSPNSDIYFTTSGICDENLVAGGKYGIMVTSAKCTMATREMKNAPPTQEFGETELQLRSSPPDAAAKR